MFTRRFLGSKRRPADPLLTRCNAQDGVPKADQTDRLFVVLIDEKKP
jgi:hypothetical protein